MADRSPISERKYRSQAPSLEGQSPVAHGVDITMKAM
jgi:hypothetical protein